jgi:hypothetical protein
MTAFAVFGILMIIGAAVGMGMSYALSNGRRVVSGIFGLDRGLGWPRGVQEEDPPPTWRLPPR